MYVTIHCCNNTPEQRDDDEFERFGNGLLAYRCMCGDTVFVSERQLADWFTEAHDEVDLDDDRPCPCGVSHTVAEHGYDPDEDE